MGNEIGIPNSHLGFTSLAATTPNLEKQFFEKLVKSLIDYSSTRETSSTYGGYNEKVLKTDKYLITKEELFQNIKRLDKDAKNPILTPSDNELLTQLFILYDINNTEKLDWKIFLVGLSACLMTCPVKEKLEFIFYNIYNNDEELTEEEKQILLTPDPALDETNKEDENQNNENDNQIININLKKRILKSDLIKILNSINLCAAYLGDKVLKRREIQSVIDNLFLSNQNIVNGAIRGEEIISYLLADPTISVFLYGKGEAMFGSAEL